MAKLAFYDPDSAYIDPVSEISDLNGADTPSNPSTAEVLTVGGSVSGTCTGSDHDWYRVTLVAGTQYTFMTQSAGGTNANPTMALRDGFGSSVAYDDDSGPGLDAQISFTPTVSGVYYVDIGQSNSTGTVLYSLGLSQNFTTNDLIPGDASTSAVLSIGGQVTGLIESNGDTDWYRVTLTAGQSYLFSLDASGGNPLGDPYLTIYDSAGAEIGYNDDGGPGLNSSLRFTATTSGTYYISAGAYSVETGNYTLSAATAPPQNPLNAIDWGTQASSGQVRIYFATTGQTYNGYTATSNWSTSQMAAVMAAGAAYSAFTNLTFVQVFTPSEATMIMVSTTGLTDAAGMMSTPPSSPAIGIFRTQYLSGSLAPGSFGMALLLHEMGHGLGLAHPHDNGGSSEVLDGVYDNDDFGIYDLNQGVFTMMSYNDGYPSLPGGTPTSLNSGFQATPMALDIAVLQAKYGIAANNAGDTVYALDGMNGLYRAIWDTGGKDTIQYDGSLGVIIDLRAATLQSGIGGGGFVSRAQSLTSMRGGFTIAHGVTIENATGGSGSDTLTGNGANNVLQGRGGNDTIDGGELIDTAVFSGNRSQYTITNNGFTATVIGPDGTDTLTGVEYFQFADQTIHWAPGAGRSINFASADPDSYMGQIRDFSGNDLGASNDWVLIGSVDVQGDGDVEYLFTNRTNGRWATVGPAADGLVYFDDYHWAGDTRVVGIYVDPLVQANPSLTGGPFDSQARFANDLRIGNIGEVLGGGDYDHDGLQEVYFALTDGTAYLHAYMHADGNIRYANYQNQQQVIDYLTSNGFGPSTYAGWFD